MKLIYTYVGGSKKNSSVQRKIIHQINELNNNGIKTEGWFFSEANEVEEKLSDTIVLKSLRKQTKSYKFFNSYYKSDNHNREILEELNKHQFDFLFIRHSYPTPRYFEILNKYADKIFLYMPSNPVAESYQERKVNKSPSILSSFLKWYEHFLFSYLKHRKLYKKIFPKLKGIIAYTPELCKILNAKSGNKSRMIYNRDGVNVNSVPLRAVDEKQTDVFKLIFLKGSSTQQPWSGLERLIKSINARPDLKFQLYICGNVIDKENYQYDFITLTGMLNGKELDDLINKVDIGVSNLANYLIGFNETTNMKSREYYARGLPFIQSNTMPDIQWTEAEQYYLYIENNASLIDMDRVKDFILRMRSDKHHIKKMRTFAENNLDWSVTVKELAESICK